MIQAPTYVISRSLDCGALPAEVNISRFQGQSGVEEFHLIVRPARYADIGAQLEWVYSAYQQALAYAGLDSGTCVFRRFFCSDLPNQAAVFETYPFDQEELCAVSYVCQPPAYPAKVALWAYHVNDPGGKLDKDRNGASLSLIRGDLEHIWSTGVTYTDEDSPYNQTENILETYEDYLQSMGLGLADNVIRTWFFVQDIDANYQELVDARKDVFEKSGLTPDTHFIASTGIEGTSADVTAKVLMDAYAISGVRDDQIEFLSAPEHLSPTAMYGVTFERGVSVAYQDRKHILISGTASINSAGEIVYPGDVLKQFDHTIDNIQALLDTAGATLQDVCSFIVYVRDPSEVNIVKDTMRGRFGPVPAVVVAAHVCRPGWLVEIECQAIIPAANLSLPVF